jgi:hypothetical protein
MKRSLLLLIPLLPLAACLTVEDFGAYWDKAGTDTRLAGNWKEVAARPDQTREHGYGIGNIFHIVERGGSYEISVQPVHDNPTKWHDRPLYPVKTLNVGPYHFLAVGKQKGLLVRYKVNATALDVCLPFGPNLVDFVESHYSNAVNMKKNKGEGSYMTIALFDKEVFKILASVPDTETLWACEFKHERVP